MYFLLLGQTEICMQKHACRILLFPYYVHRHCLSWFKIGVKCGKCIGVEVVATEKLFHIMISSAVT